VIQCQGCCGLSEDFRGDCERRGKSINTHSATLTLLMIEGFWSEFYLQQSSFSAEESQQLPGMSRWRLPELTEHGRAAQQHQQIVTADEVGITVVANVASIQHGRYRPE
jgi:hypothetical protein